jgi:hypothetical protein
MSREITMGIFHDAIKMGVELTEEVRKAVYECDYEFIEIQVTDNYLSSKNIDTSYFTMTYRLISKNWNTLYTINVSVHMGTKEFVASFITIDSGGIRESHAIKITSVSEVYSYVIKLLQSKRREYLFDMLSPYDVKNDKISSYLNNIFLNT